MKMIILTGNSNIGKTTVLTLAYNELLALHAMPTSKSVVLGDPVQKDFEITLEWMSKKIAFFTMGDFSLALMKAARKYDALGFDVFICACNNRFTKPLRLFGKIGKPCHVIPKVEVQDPAIRDISNKLTASLIVSHV